MANRGAYYSQIWRHNRKERRHQEIERRIRKLRGEWRECGVKSEEMDRRSAVIREKELELYYPPDLRGGNVLCNDKALD